MTSLSWPPPSTCHQTTPLSAAEVSTHASELLSAVAELLTRQQPDDVPVLHNASTIQQVTHIEFRMLELPHELGEISLHSEAVVTKPAWSTTPQQLIKMSHVQELP